jgi:hypothetical protein
VTPGSLVPHTDPKRIAIPAEQAPDLSQSVHRAYERLKKPAAYAFVGLALLGAVVQSMPLQVAALGALGVLILETLFAIRKHIEELETPRVFADFFETTAAMRSEMLRRLERNGSLRVRAMGMSMGHAWPFFMNTLAPLLRDGKHAISLDIAMLDADWPDLVALNPGWVSRAKANADDIARLGASVSVAMQGSGSSLGLSLYRHMPNWHGVLIDDDLLFLSTCFWQGGTLTGAENRYELLSNGDPLLGAPRITQFRSWFDHILSLPTTRSWPQGNV